MDTSAPRLWGDKRYHTLNYYLRQRHGGKVFKIPLDAGFTCPNRDGTLSENGCLYCSARGSGDYAGDRGLSLAEQFHNIKMIMHRKWPNAMYIAYFQAFTNTYADPDRLRALYAEALSQPGVVGLSVATRPDCVPAPVLDVLAEFNQLTRLSVELGLQTIHRNTAESMNLQYDYDDFLGTLHNLVGYGIDTCVHIILGLPGETRDQMVATAQAVADLPVQGIKIHLLHIMKGTRLGQMYQQQPFPTLTQNEYVELVADILELLPPEIVIHRLTGDSPRQLLIAPAWSLQKWEILNQIDSCLQSRHSWQGKHYQEECFPRSRKNDS